MFGVRRVVHINIYAQELPKIKVEAGREVRSGTQYVVLELKWDDNVVAIYADTPDQLKEFVEDMRIALRVGKIHSFG